MQLIWTRKFLKSKKERKKERKKSMQLEMHHHLSDSDCVVERDGGKQVLGIIAK